jgi:hypothetical protein
VTDVTQGVTVPATSNGWYYDLGTGWRMVINPTDYNNSSSSSSSSSSNNVELIAGDTKGEIPKIPTNLTGTISTRLLTWLEVPTAE